MNLLIALFLIIAEAIYEGLYDDGHKLIAGMLEFIYKALITLAVFVLVNMGLPHSNLQNGDLIYVLIGYVFLRYAIFDAIYNLTRNLGLTYVGTTKLFDKAQSWLIDKWGYTIILLTKFIALLWGVAWLMDWQDGIKF